MRKVYSNHSLTSLNTFHVESRSSFFSQPENIIELKEIVEYGFERELEILVIGEGSNLLLRNNFQGLAIHPVIHGIQLLDESGSEVLVRVGAGENWDHFVSHCVKNC